MTDRSETLRMIRAQRAAEEAARVERIVQIVPATGVSASYQTGDLADEAFTLPVILWALKANGGVVPLTCDPSGYITEAAAAVPAPSVVGADNHYAGVVFDEKDGG
jgi:hypothetical protein